MTECNQSPDGQKFDGTWTNKFYNFDNFTSSFTTLFVVGSGEIWSDTLYTSIAATEVGKAPERENNRSLLIFYVVYSTENI